MKFESLTTCPVCGKSAEYRQVMDMIGHIQEESTLCYNCGYYKEFAFGEVAEGIDFRNAKSNYLIKFNQFIHNPSSLLIDILPVKVGDTIYTIANGDFYSQYEPYINEIEVTEISWKRNRSGKDLEFAAIANGCRYKFSNIGKSWFTSKQDAEDELSKSKQK